MEWSRHGDLLAGRYRLRDLLSEKRQGRFWRADDEILGRPVAIHVLAAHDERAALLMEAARASASVADHRLLRVLDAETTGSIAFVVNEWGEGISLDHLLGTEGPLAPRRAAQVTAEVAEVISAAHALGYAHGRLNPENVLIDGLGAVRIIGFAVEAALHGLPAGQLDRDVKDLGGLLYAGLTARWAGVAESAVPPAPRSHGRLLRARQVRAGVPRLLDELCDRVLDDDQPGFTTAIEVQAGLAEYSGDPLDLPTAPPPPGSSPAPAAGKRRADVPLPPAPASGATDPTTAVPLEEPLPAADPEATQAMPADPEATQAMPADPDATQPGLPVFDDTGGTGETDAVGERGDRSVTGGSAKAGSTRPAPPPPPPLEEQAPKPLFADEAPAPRQFAPEPAARTAPSSWPDTGGHPRPARSASPARPPAAWVSGEPIELAEEPVDDHPGRNWLRLAIGIAVVAVLVVAAVVAYNLGRGGSVLGGDPEEPNSPSPSATVPARPVSGVTATDFDPFGDPPQEYPDLAPLTVDGDPATSWRTSRYNDNFTSPQGLKPGVGVVLDLGSPHAVESVRLQLIGAPTTVEVFVSAQPPTTAPEANPAGRQRIAATEGEVTLEGSPQGRYVLVWLTELPAVSGGFRAEIAEATVVAARAG